MTLTQENYVQTRLAELESYQQEFSRLFYFLENEELLFIPEGEQWSAIEVIEHLNATASLYLPQWAALLDRPCDATQKDVSLGWVARKLRAWMESSAEPGNKWNQSPKKFLPRRMVDPDLKLDPQKVMETFLGDLDEVRRIVAQLPARKCRTKRIQTAAPVKVSAIAALELYLPHVGRHLKQAERILNGGKKL